MSCSTRTVAVGRTSALLLLMPASFVVGPVRAQQAPTPMNPMQMPSMDTMQMSSSVDLLSPMSQEASGTAWLPSSSPMYGKMIMKPDGDALMLHGAITPRYTDVGSDRGDSRVDAPNWLMGMFSRPLGPNDQLGLRAMLSLDPITEGGYGYPLLFQTGETWHGQPLHDRQHPHDLFSELSVDYSHRLRDNLSSYAYVGYPGEPALGPPTYMHRLIALDLPDAPIGHHWQDATHITFGVATAGLNFGNHLKLEAGVFTGREPDENRYNFERPRFDSQSGRISFNPSADHALQISYGSIKNPEGDGVQQHRITASWIYDKPLGADANLTTTMSWGQNILAVEEGRSNSYLGEADYQFGAHSIFSRVEFVQKSGQELVLPVEADADTLYGVGACTVGYLRDLTHGRGIDTGVGGAVTINTKPTSLDPFYGRGTPVGFQVMLRIRPSRAQMGMKGSMAGMGDMAGMGTMNGSEGGQKSAAIAAVFTPSQPQARQTTHLVVTVTDAKGNPMTGATVQVTVNMTTMDMGTEHPVVTEKGAGLYSCELTFAMSGVWRVTVTVQPKEPAAVGAGSAPVTRSFDVTVVR